MYTSASKPKAKGKKNKGRKKMPQYRRKRGRKASPENDQLLQLLKPSEQDVMKLLAAQVHIGRRRTHVNMKRYIWKRRQDGINVINLEKTWAKIILAARILVTIRQPSDICVMSTRSYGQRGAIKFAHYTGATALVGKWVPGTFTNPQNKAFFEPRILIVDDPSTCFAALRETSYVGIPVIALCGTDNNTRFVDCAVPCNNRGKFSIGLMFWLLSRELLRMRGDPDCIRSVEWKESVDLFFYRDADQIKRQQDAKFQRQQRELQAAQFENPEAVVPEFTDEVAYQQAVMQAEQNWEVEPDTVIEDWGANDEMRYAEQQPYDQVYEDPNQAQYVEEQQQVAPEQQQYVDSQQMYQQQMPPQGYENPNQGMQMRNW